MKTKQQPLIQFEDLEFDHERQLLRAEYLDYKGLHRTIYTDFWDFEEWVKRNDYLTIDNEFRNPVSGEFYQSTHQIKLEDLLTDSAYEDYREILAKDFFKEMLNFQHLAEYFTSRALVKRFKEEVMVISHELESALRLSA